MAIGRTNCGLGNGSGLPQFTYTGTYTLVDDGSRNWRIKFLTSGTLVFTKNPGALDLFLVGAGGSGSASGSGSAGSGGGGGYTDTSIVQITLGTEYQVAIGAGSVGSSGGTTSAFGKNVSGGQCGSGESSGGNGGSGGAGGALTGAVGGTDGADGGHTQYSTGGSGQHTTTREFGEAAGALYASGGNGTSSPTAKPANSGSGGDGSPYGTVQAASAGAAGIAVLRNHREVGA